MSEPSVISMWAELFGRPVTMDRLKEYATQHKAVIDALRERRRARVAWAREMQAERPAMDQARALTEADAALSDAIEALEELL